MVENKEVIERVLVRFQHSVGELAERVGFAENSIRKWRKNGGITRASRESVSKKLGFDNWGQLARFLVPHDGEVFVLQHLSQDLGRVWEHYLHGNANPIFETRIALSHERPLMLGFSSKANTLVRKKIAEGSVTVHRVEQPRTVKRLAELTANAYHFRRQQNYSLRVVPPQREEHLFTYPNIIRFGKKVLVLGRTHKIGTPGASDPLVLLNGSAAEVLGDHLEGAIWNDSNAKVFSTLEETQREDLCREWAAILQGPSGADEYDKTYRELLASAVEMEKLRV